MHWSGMIVDSHDILDFMIHVFFFIGVCYLLVFFVLTYFCAFSNVQRNYRYFFMFISSATILFILSLHFRDMTSCEVWYYNYLFVIFSLLTSGGLCYCTVFQEVPFCICRCRFKPIPCTRQKDNLQNFCRKSEHNCQVIWLEFCWVNIYNWC